MTSKSKFRKKKQTICVDKTRIKKMAIDPSKIMDGWNMNLQRLNLKYTQPKNLDTGGKIVNFKQKLLIRSPMQKTYGARDFVKEGQEVGDGKFKLGMQFSCEDEEEGVEPGTSEEAIYKKNMLALDDLLRNEIFIHSVEWFGKTKSKEVIEELYSPIVRFPKTNNVVDYTREPAYSIKLPRYDDVWKFQIFDEEANCLFPNASDPFLDPLTLIPKSGKVANLFSVNGFVIINQSIFPSLSLVQTQVSSFNASTDGICFLPSKPKKNNNKTVANGASNGGKDNYRKQATFIESDGEDEEEHNNENEDDDEEEDVGANRKRKGSFSVVYPPSSENVDVNLDENTVANANVDANENETVATTTLAIPNPDVANEDEDDGTVISSAAPVATATASTSEEPAKKRKVIKKKEEKKVA